MEKPNCDTPDALWGDDDEQFDLGLEKWGLTVEELKKPLGEGLQVVGGGLGECYG